MTNKARTSATASSNTSQISGLFKRLTAGAVLPVSTIVVAIIVVWYASAILMNAPFQRDLNRIQNVMPDSWTFIQLTLNQNKPVVPAPHQVAQDLWKSTIGTRITSKRSLVYHSWVTLSSTLLGFGMATVFGIVLATFIVHTKVAEKTLMPWVIISQTIPILALAPMLVLMLEAIGIRGLIPKALMSTYLAFFPITIGMVKGLRAPNAIELDLMRTYNANAWQTFWKLRWPTSMPYLFTSMKVAIAIALVGAIVSELPADSQGGLAKRLLLGPYYGNIVATWSALFMAAFSAALLVTLVGIVERQVRQRMGMRMEMAS